MAAVVIGYPTTGLLLAFILPRSEIKHISKTIREYYEEEGLLSVSDDDKSSSNSASSSSSDNPKENNHLKNKDIRGQNDDDLVYSDGEVAELNMSIENDEIQVMPTGMCKKKVLL